VAASAVPVLSDQTYGSGSIRSLACPDGGRFRCELFAGERRACGQEPARLLLHRDPAQASLDAKPFCDHVVQIPNQYCRHARIVEHGGDIVKRYHGSGEAAAREPITV
jgi:hypothetical protein